MTIRSPAVLKLGNHSFHWARQKKEERLRIPAHPAPQFMLRMISGVFYWFLGKPRVEGRKQANLGDFVWVSVMRFGSLSPTRGHGDSLLVLALGHEALANSEPATLGIRLVHELLDRRVDLGTAFDGINNLGGDVR